jgi:SAM-dependent MidA family methyltransferase
VVRDALPCAQPLGNIQKAVSAFAAIQYEIRANGPMTFARFMEIALYSTDGYYENQERVGKGGDFYTSVSVGALFGQLLARQITSWLRETETFQIIEVGAHDGALARDIVTWLQTNEHDPKIEYVIVEPSAKRRTWQKQTLGQLNCVRWEQNLPAEVRGVILSNELLDAMPVHRLRWNAQKRSWEEWLVVCEDDQLKWIVGKSSVGLNDCAPIVAEPLADVLPDGFTVDLSPAAVKWWNDAARALRKGRLVAIDYGLNEDELFRPDRSNGTARAYLGHRLVEDLLSNVGEQDITAHVNWSAIRRAGEDSGLQTETFSSQEQFLMTVIESISSENWTAEQIRQLKTLTHPNFLGRAFRVLVQRRD